jgi:hypothetical protein
MPTDCRTDSLDFGTSAGRRLVGGFDGGAITSNGGVLLLGAVDRRIKLTERVARCFRDLRAPEWIVHPLDSLIRQRVYGLALAYEDLVDHDQLRHDPALTAALGRPEGALAGKSTLNRLEHAGKIGGDRYHKIDHDAQAFERLFVDVFLDSYREPRSFMVIDLDATDDPLYGNQEGRHFHSYYDCYCYLPLYIFCDRHLLAAKLRSASVDAAAGSVEEVSRIVAHIRERWPDVRIVIRADSGFCRDDLMAWCEGNGVDYVLGLAGNVRLVAEVASELKLARRRAKWTGQPARVFKDFRYQTRESWSCERRVIAKAEWTQNEGNPRFIVTNIHAANGAARFLYEDLYCKRGEMENRIKECQTDLFADRTPTPTMQANQLRLWLSSLAYVLLCAVRRIGLAGTKLENATCGTIRLQLLKIGALVIVSVRRVKVAFASSCPSADVFARAARRLCTGA